MSISIKWWRPLQSDEKSMSSFETFYPFPRFPPEIRRIIYLLATPPRYVFVNEYPKPDSDSYGDFCESFDTRVPIPGNLTIHPSLAYFAHNWCQRVRVNKPPREAWNFNTYNARRSKSLQTTLDSYGFMSSKKPYQPWTPTADVPEIPAHWLAERPALAWHFTRESHFRSRTPIPPLLHTCTESRQVLIDYGYELTFRTRTSGPRVWFCYCYDVLCLLSRGYDDSCGVLDGCPWNIGQFLPDDLRRVRRLAIQDTFDPSDECGIALTSGALRLFSGIRELLLIQQNLRWAHKFWFPGVEEAGDQGEWTYLDDQELWDWVAPDLADILDYDLRRNRERLCLEYYDATLAEYERVHKGDLCGFFQYVSKKYETGLRDERVRVLGVREEGQMTVTTSWNIPSVTLVTSGPKHAIRALLRCRERYWQDPQERDYRNPNANLRSLFPF
ncbi:hypothetical protein PAAG_03284 [Paracoccidioides lutzii Pb01]|uniref:2EXR domain-containing protein n=1 Tax=Paracoccidioides lutzii (strain ATCC MYA-826 / Pb01) TaxID=502779 RepID=C1GY01_PARBA|nr:hypothetical protein PAAG_03284 [Paracoccidioides lutzii Pb01]EEH41721.2 hypothetical protein PAAG_03284 [Paracoccidioides lutzii Pb01]